MCVGKLKSNYSHGLIKYNQPGYFRNQAEKKIKHRIFMVKNENFQIKPRQGDYVPTGNTLS